MSNLIDKGRKRDFVMLFNEVVEDLMVQNQLNFIHRVKEINHLKPGIIRSKKKLFLHGTVALFLNLSPDWHSSNFRNKINLLYS